MKPISPSFVAPDIDALKETAGRIAVLITPDGKLDVGARRVNRLTKGAILRVIESAKFAEMSEGSIQTLAFPAGMAADAVDVVKLSRRAAQDLTRKAGVSLAKLSGTADVTVLAGNLSRAAELAFGYVARKYDFTDHKTAEPSGPGALTLQCNAPDETVSKFAPLAAIADGIFMTRDLVNEPANILTTTEFATRLKEMEALGLDIEVLEEDELEALGMRTLLCVGQGSDSPSKVVVMQWNGGEKEQAPLALVGKGVVFDTGGISLKPASGMEDMTMDMGGAGTVAGTMRALAMRQAKANVVGLVGLVENMPSGNAVRPGDVIRSMKGDTVEVINTDAEGRLVLCDVMWYAQDRFAPSGMIDLATLTGAIIVGLGYENAGVFSNDNKFANAFLKAANTENEGAWQMPLGQGYDDLLKSRVADMKNIGGRPAGSITAAQFLKRFVKDETPWIHLDIAGVASVKSETTLAPKGATGWGVLALSRLVSDMFES